MSRAPTWSGSLSPSVFLGRLVKGIDVREHGSGNAGATNAFRVLGTRLGIVVLAADVLKGFLPVLLARYVLRSLGHRARGDGGLGRTQLVDVPEGKGGKGVATGAGVILAMMPVILARAGGRLRDRARLDVHRLDRLAGGDGPVPGPDHRDPRIRSPT